MFIVTSASVQRLLLALLFVVAAMPLRAAIDPDLTEPSNAGRIHLTDGTVIVGVVTGIRDGKVKVETAFSDDALKIPAEMVANFEQIQETHLLLDDESVVTLPAIEVVEGALVLENETIALVDIDVMNPEPWEKGQGFKWTGDTSAALAVARGNTDTNELDVALNTVLKSIKDRYTLNGSIDKDDTGSAGTDVRTDTADKWKLLGKYDYFLTNDRNYLGFNLAVESDALADIDIRTYVGPYFGRVLLDNDIISLDGELGLAYVSTEYSALQVEDIECLDSAGASRGPKACAFDKKSYGALNWNLTGESKFLGGSSKLYLRHVGIVGTDRTQDVLLKTTAGLAFPLVFGFQAAAEISVDYDGSLEQEVDQKYSFRVGYAW